jgi:phosphate transport system substrate-binding protein
MRKISGILVTSALVASIALVAPAAYANQTITGSGSSYMNAFHQVCIPAYQATTTDKVTYTSTGSGTGKTQFGSGATQYGASDSLYSSDAPANFTYVPLVGGPVGIAYNVKGVTRLNLSSALLDGIFSGKIKKWNDPKIKAENASAKLPNKKIQVVYRSDGSGTTNNFGNFMRQTVGKKWSAADAWADALGKTPVGTSARTNQGVVATVKGLANSITYADTADAKSAKLRFAWVKTATGYVQPTVAASAKFLAAQPLSSSGEVVFDYKKSVRGGYPITLVAYGLAPTKSSNAAVGASVKKYFTYLINTCGPQLAAKNNYVAITGALKTKALQLVARIK